jgi:hypothetical protein
MDEVEKFSRQLTFYSVYTILRKRQELDEASKLRIDDARSFLEDLAKSLESMISLNGPLFIVDDLKDSIGALGGKLENVTRDEIRQYTQQIRGYTLQLRELKTNPNEFYGREKFDCLIESCKRLSDLYTENHRVFVCED